MMGPEKRAERVSIRCRSYADHVPVFPLPFPAGVFCKKHFVAVTRYTARRFSLCFPHAAGQFSFEIVPADQGFDVFEVEASGGRITVRGNSAVAMCRGAYDYLKRDCNALVTWDGNQLNLPSPLPAAPRRRIVSPARFRHFLQTCTFGYSMPFWDWARWEKQIDWMALHGINFPLSLTGQEKVFQNVFRSYGFTEAEINAYFSGPAFLPWNRGGNLIGHEGPLPQSYIDFQADLQKKILARHRELGMMPITPGFQGFVPPAFKTRFPAVKTTVTSFAGAPTAAQVKARSDFKLLVNGLDALLATVPNYSLDRWIKSARAIAPEADRSHMEWNARVIMSPYWFGDYCFRDWSGLAGQYYRMRWDRFFAGGAAEVDRFYGEWFRSNTLLTPEKVDAVEQVKKMLALTDPGVPIPDAVQPLRSAIKPKVFLTGSDLIEIAVEGEGPYSLSLYTPEGKFARSFSGHDVGLHQVGTTDLPAGLYLATLRMLGMGRPAALRILIP